VFRTISAEPNKSVRRSASPLTCTPLLNSSDSIYYTPTVTVSHQQVKGNRYRTLVRADSGPITGSDPAVQIPATEPAAYIVLDREIGVDSQPVSRLLLGLIAHLLTGVDVDDTTSPVIDTALAAPEVGLRVIENLEP